MNDEVNVSKLELTLEGMADIMFDKFMGQEKDIKPPEQKLYLAEGNKVVLPAENLYSFLFAENPAGCAKSLEGKGSKEYIRLGYGHVLIDPEFIPFQRNGKDVIYKDFDDGNLYVCEFSPRAKMGNLSIKQNIKRRPVLKAPWNLTFQITIIKNTKVDTQRILNWFTRGGILIGLGTYRPRFGRFNIAKVKEL